MKAKIIHLTIAFLVFAFANGNSCKLKRVKISNSTRGFDLKLEFKNVIGDVEYEANVNAHDEFHLLTYSIPGCDNAAKGLPAVEYPIMHVEVLDSENSEDGNLNVNFYLKNKPPISHSSKKGTITSTFAVSETFPDEAPKVLDEFSAKSASSNTVTMKFTFDEIPSIMQGFMNKRRDVAVFVFANTAAASPPKRPNVRFIKDFKVSDGITFAGVPFTKLVISSADQMFYTESPEANIYIVELYGQEDVDENSGVQSASAYVPREGTSGIDVEEYEKMQDSYQTSDRTKTFLYWGLGGLLVGYGGYYAYGELTKPKPIVETLPSIEEPDESIFPDN